MSELLFLEYKVTQSHLKLYFIFMFPTTYYNVQPNTNTILAPPLLVETILQKCKV